MPTIQIDGNDITVAAPAGSLVNVVCEAFQTDRNRRVFKRYVGESDQKLQERIQEEVDEARNATATASSPSRRKPDPMSPPRLEQKPNNKKKLSPSVMPPPRAKRPVTRGLGSEDMAVDVDTPLQQTVAPSNGSSISQEYDATAALKRMQKKAKETERLIDMQRDGKRLSTEELEKVAQLGHYRNQIALLQQGSTPFPSTPVQSHTSVSSMALGWRSRSSLLSAASTQVHWSGGINSGKAATAFNEVSTKMKSMSMSPMRRRQSTRATAEEMNKEMEEVRRRLERERIEVREEAQQAGEALLRLLKSPFDSWGGDAIWQLVMWEYALVQLDNTTSTPKQMFWDFRSLCEEARHPSGVPRLRGSLQIDALQEALGRSRELHDTLVIQLNRWKVLYCSMFAGFGRFRKLSPDPCQTLLHVMRQTHRDALEWRKQAVLIQQFCDGIHWHNLALVGPEKRLYYWEPKDGIAMSGRDPIRTAFTAAAADDWTFQSIRVKLQADGHSCGDWAHYFRCCVLAYVADGDKLGTHSLSAFLTEHADSSLTDLKGLKGTPLREAEQRQRRFALRRRNALRELLRTAAEQSNLPWGEVNLDDFRGGRSSESPTIDLTTLDEELPEDDEDVEMFAPKAGDTTRNKMGDDSAHGKQEEEEDHSNLSGKYSASVLLLANAEEDGVADADLAELRAKKDEAYKALHSLMMRMEGRRANASRVAAEIKEGASIHAIDSCALDVYGIDHRSPDNLYKVPKSELPRLVRSLRRLIAGGRVSAQQKEYYIVCRKTFEREIAQLAQLEASAKQAFEALL